MGNKKPALGGFWVWAMSEKPYKIEWYYNVLLIGLLVPAVVVVLGAFWCLGLLLEALL